MEKVKFKVTSEEVNDEQELQITDPVRQLNLGETAYKIERNDMADTKKELKGLDLSYYTLRGGEVVSKEFDEDRTVVVFNKEKADEFQIPLKGKHKSFDRIETWYPDKKQALAVVKQLSMVELDKSKALLGKREEANNFIEHQLNNNSF